jgi:ssDNA-binding Zn-finger/Zn-ribbon topoisomerase 1
MLSGRTDLAGCRYARRRDMAYLNCPTCRLTVYSPVESATFEECPRCRAKLGKASRLFRSALPPRLQEKVRKPLGGTPPERASTP